MTSRFLPSLPSLAGILLLALAASGAAAAEKPPRRIVKTGSEGFAQVRFWNLCPEGTAPVNVKLQGKEPSDWLTSIRWFDVTDYATLEPGTFQLTVLDEATGALLGKGVVRAEASTWTTAILQPNAEGKPTLTIMDDTYDFDPAAPGRVAVVNAVPGCRAAFALPGGPSQSLAPGERKEIADVPTATNRISLSTTLGDAKPIVSSLPLDFQFCKQITILVLMDRYGDLTTRSFHDGLFYNAAVVNPVVDE